MMDKMNMTAIDSDLLEELIETLKLLLSHACKTNEAFYVKGTTKALREAFQGQRDLIKQARAALTKAGVQ